MTAADDSGNVVRRANLDGASVQTILTFSTNMNPRMVAVDSVNGKICITAHAQHRVPGGPDLLRQKKAPAQRFIK